MAKRITILSLEKTPEYINREWASVMGKRLHLLSSTDWTQIEDNELTFESRVRWNHWRNQVRDVKRTSYDTPDDADKALSILESTLPEKEFISSRTLRQKKYHLDLNDIHLAKSDAHMILRTLHTDWILTLLPESVHLINAKVDELLRYYTISPQPESLEEFPIMEAMQRNNDYSQSEVVEEIMNLKRLLTTTMVSVENHRMKFTKLIDSATTIDEVVGIVKNMHGY